MQHTTADGEMKKVFAVRQAKGKAAIVCAGLMAVLAPFTYAQQNGTKPPTSPQTKPVPKPAQAPTNKGLDFKPPAPDKGLDFKPSSPVSSASRAIVIGVDKYPSLRPGAGLDGCVSDAKQMSDELKREGFEVILLTDAQATREGILSSLRAMQEAFPKRPAATSINTRFVLYFAGHGTRNSEGVSTILPSDAEDASDKYDISAPQLRDTVQAIPAGSTTVVLDSAHSGGMAYNSSDRICYFTSALKTQLSLNSNTDNKSGGVFTHALLEELRSGKHKTWQELVDAVTASVKRDSENEQQPFFSPAFLPRPIWGDVKP